MSYEKTIICFANSRKMSGRCVAGREFSGGTVGDWIRPVSSRGTEEVSEEERGYQDGRDPRVLDVIRIQFLEARPHGWQQENHLLDDRTYWGFLRRATWSELESAVQPLRGPLWKNGDSSYYGVNDRVSETVAQTFSSSLCLIQPSNLRLIVATEGAEFGDAPRRKVRADFSYDGEPYRIAVTDPVTTRECLAMADGEHKLNDAYLCVSLGEPWKGEAYKLVAAVITSARLWSGT